MPKFRKLWTKTLDSFDFNEMPDDFARVVWLLLPLVLDSKGRGIDMPAWVCSRMFPLRRVDETDITSAFDFFESRDMIGRYKVDGRAYFYLKNWTTYQSGTEKEAESVLPPPPDLLQTNSGVNPEQVDAAASASASVNASESLTRPEIFGIYEHEIGPLTPAIADDLMDAEKEYPHEYILDALKEASRNNKRSWKYALAILKRWKVEGRAEKPKQQRQEDTALAEAQMKLYGRAG